MTLEDFISFRLKDYLKGLFLGDDHLEVTQCGFYHHDGHKNDGYLCLHFTKKERQGYDTYLHEYYLECNFRWEYLPKTSYIHGGLGFNVLGFNVEMINADDDDMKVLGEVMSMVKGAIRDIPLVTLEEMDSIGVELLGRISRDKI